MSDSEEEFEYEEEFVDIRRFQMFVVGDEVRISFVVLVMIRAFGMEQLMYIDC